MKVLRQKKGFTLLEILLVIAAIGILAAIVLVAINPNKQIEAARAAKRKSDINTIVKSIGQYAIDNNGQYPVGIDTGAKVICPNSSPPVGCVNLNLLSPDYIAAIPEPDTGYYYVRRNSAGTSIEVTHPKDGIWNTGGTPRLDLNFASNKSLIDTVSGNSLITFTRASTGTYVGEDGLIRTAAINEPRFDHNPITKESLGLLVEEQRTNLLTNSSDYSSGGSNVTVTIDNILAPDGTQTAELVSGNVGTSNKNVNKTFGTTTTGTYTTSVFVKAGTENFVVLRMNDQTGVNGTRQRFNLSSGTLDGSVANDGANTGGSATITPYPDRWYRLTVTGTFVNALTSIQAGQVWLNGYAGNALTTTYYVWGAQLELGSSPTSYIPTLGVSGTRSVDNTNITGTNFSSLYTQGPGSLYTEAYATLGVDQQYVSISQELPGGVFNVRSRKNGINSYSLVLRDGVTRDISQSPLPSLVNNQLIKIATAYNTNDTALSGGGQSIITGNTLSMGTYNRLDIGPYSAIGATCSSCTIRRITYWPTRLSNAILSNISR